MAIGWVRKCRAGQTRRLFEGLLIQPAPHWLQPPFNLQLATPSNSYYRKHPHMRVYVQVCLLIDVSLLARLYHIMLSHSNKITDFFFLHENRQTSIKNVTLFLFKSLTHITWCESRLHSHGNCLSLGHMQKSNPSLSSILHYYFLHQGMKLCKFL